MFNYFRCLNCRKVHYSCTLTESLLNTFTLFPLSPWDESTSQPFVEDPNAPRLPSRESIRSLSLPEVPPAKDGVRSSSLPMAPPTHNRRLPQTVPEERLSPPPKPPPRDRGPSPKIPKMPPVRPDREDRPPPSPLGPSHQRHNSVPVHKSWLWYLIYMYIHCTAEL